MFVSPIGLADALEAAGFFWCFPTHIWSHVQVEFIWAVSVLVRLAVILVFIVHLLCYSAVLDLCDEMRRIKGIMVKPERM